MKLKYRFTLTISLILSFHSTFFAQDFLWNEKGMIIEHYDFVKTDTIKNHYTIDSTINRFSLIVSSSDSLRVDYYIRPYTNGTIDLESICDSIVLSLYCERCIPVHSQRLIDTKRRKWQKLSDSLFFSRKWVSKHIPGDKSGKTVRVPYLLIDKQESHTQITLFTKVLLMEEWKRMKKGKI